MTIGERIIRLRKIKEKEEEEERNKILEDNMKEDGRIMYTGSESARQEGCKIKENILMALLLYIQQVNIYLVQMLLHQFLLKLK